MIRARRSDADAVAAILAKLAPAPVVKTVDLPGLPGGGDIVDWIDAHGDAAEPGELRRQVAVLVDAVEPIDRDAKTGAAAAVMVRLADVIPEPIRWL